MFAQAALILWLVPSMLAPSQVPAHGAARQTPAVLRIAGAPAAVVTATRRSTALRRSHRAAARAVERRLLLVAPRSRLLARFVDHATGLVKRNVATRCARVWGRQHRRLPRFVCRVWLQPRSPSSGVAVVCHTKHGHFRVTAYHRRHRRP